MESSNTCLVVMSLDPALENMKTIRKCFEKSVDTLKCIRHINDDFNDFSYSDESDQE